MGLKSSKPKLQNVRGIRRREQFGLHLPIPTYTHRMQDTDYNQLISYRTIRDVTINKSKPLVPGNVLERAVSALRQGDASLSGAVLHFLYNTCKANKEVAVDYLQCDGLVSALQPLVAPGSTTECCARRIRRMQT